MGIDEHGGINPAMIAELVSERSLGARRTRPDEPFHCDVDELLKEGPYFND
ncbi:hypothetical protein AB0D78_45045 [Streptomyces avermitilis]|uniref:hypothetical protein n=1 Tax=Streptomyces avermitilis TaxID=33903 RepID=UPI0033D98871